MADPWILFGVAALVEVSVLTACFCQELMASEYIFSAQSTPAQDLLEAVVL